MTIALRYGNFSNGNNVFDQMIALNIAFGEGLHKLIHKSFKHYKTATQERF